MTDKEKEIMDTVYFLVKTLNGNTYPGRQNRVRNIVDRLAEDLAEYFMEKHNG